MCIPSIDICGQILKLVKFYFSSHCLTTFYWPAFCDQIWKIVKFIYFISLSHYLPLTNNKKYFISGIKYSLPQTFWFVKYIKILAKKGILYLLPTQWYGFARFSVSWPRWRGANMSRGGGTLGPWRRWGRGTDSKFLIGWIFYEWNNLEIYKPVLRELSSWDEEFLKEWCWSSHYWSH